MKRVWHRRLLMVVALSVCLLCTAVPMHPVRVSAQSVSAQSAPGLTLENVGTPEVYFAHRGEPLLSFGGLSDLMFYTAPDAFDYEHWADWAADHGMNHVRAYPPISWKFVEKISLESGGSPDNFLFPYEETSPGSRQFDLTRFNEAYWQRFRKQCEYLQSKGIIIHLLMVNGWNGRPDENNWGGHFFNPDNNINDFADGLKDNRLGLYKTVTDGRPALVEAQKAWFQKIVEQTADLDNVYYDLVHEMAEDYEDWRKAKAWIDTMAQTVRQRFEALQPERSIILGMDTGGFENQQRDWIFSRPYFDVLIYGKAHKVEQAKAWRSRYKKPYIPQESWDDDGTKYSLRNPKHRVHLRKYLWKFMMAKCQQMDTYIKPVSDDPITGLRHNYDPEGRTRFEEDAKVLRALWNQLTDYPNLKFEGRVQSGPGDYQTVLSSQQEGLIYLSSATRKETVSFEAQALRLKNLALAEGLYTANIIKPDQGPLSSLEVRVNRGRAELSLPAFTDDLAIHLSQPTTNSSNHQATGSEKGNTLSTRVIALIALIALVALPLALVSSLLLNRRSKTGH